MKDLKYYQEKIQAKRKQSDFTTFMQEIGSWLPLTFYKHDGYITKKPSTQRQPHLVPLAEFEELRDSLTDYGLDYDDNMSFFENYQELFSSIPITPVVNYGGSENSDFSDMVLESKNVYLSTGVITECENILYGFSVKGNSSDVINGLAVWTHSNTVYFCSGVVQSYKIFYSRFINNCNNIWFSSNMNGCSECLFCNDLDNCTYYIHNKKYEKQEYLKEKERLLNKKQDFFQYYKNVDTVGKNIASSSVKGSAIFNSEDIENGYHVDNVKTGRNLILVGGKDGNENMYDVFPGGSPIANDFYGVMGANGSHLYCCINIVASSNMYYCNNCISSSYCIGCIGLKNKQYCILNKQYTKEEWEVLADKIFSQMESDDILGDFFPGEINPFYFNDTMAGLLGNFAKQEVEKKGYMWRSDEIKVDIPEGSNVITTSELNDFQGFDEDNNWKINPDILNKVIIDEKGDYYRIVQMEYDFLVKHGLPLPEIHWMYRIKLNFGI